MTGAGLDATAQLVPKLATDEHRFRRPARHYDSARAAIRAFVRAAGAKTGDTVLCPAYVGWSSREGSGVLDPLESLGLRVEFYRVGADLAPDLEDLSVRLFGRPPIGALVIHFFGHVDPTYPQAVRMVRESGAWVLEDEAHALFTDLVTGATGRLGDASVFSLHKLLPVPDGGALLVNPDSDWPLDPLDAPIVPPSLLWEHDLSAMASQRQRNTETLTELLMPLAGRVEPLWPAVGEADVLQTYPVLVPGVDRDRVYELMNARGYGVVSLYHTLVKGISPAEYPASHALSRTILNLPVHQDLRDEQLTDLIAHLTAVVDELGPGAAR